MGVLGLIRLVSLLFWLYNLLILVRCVMSWLRPPAYGSPWLSAWRFVFAATEPALAPIRRLLAPLMRGSPLDFSPIALFLLLSVLERVIIRVLIGIL